MTPRAASGLWLWLREEAIEIRFLQRRSNKEVDVLGEARPTVEGDRVPTDEDILNLMRVQ